MRCGEQLEGTHLLGEKKEMGQHSSSVLLPVVGCESFVVCGLVMCAYLGLFLCLSVRFCTPTPTFFFFLDTPLPFPLLFLLCSFAPKTPAAVAKLVLHLYPTCACSCQYALTTK